ncbi:pyrroline-5-carboxylate reductase [Helicobacter sp. MIT 05-5294]|uniref:pyrroline-5-carboxylate reductase n=1 Tax=Helicobacter sp. MIT 05-5294 TaxID=1548150 RepID=UPI00051FD217|nr:pyrroline-5-carboxylate reductase [Helicobacter sp. MIT 05-5294]TLD85445.1 pyrroline-5-carboxylate reductase [Helicobacter sp. MIT 05-5294]
MKSLILLGYGKMAKALAQGLKQRYNLRVCGRNFAKVQAFCEELGLTPLALENSTIPLKEDDEILLCVKPYALKEFYFHGKAKCVYSILNATSLATLRETIESQNYIRAMPNVCASVGQSITSLCGDLAYQQEAFGVFDSIGKSVWLEEKDFPLATALGGCAPAFLALVAESLIDSGVTYGLGREDSTQIVRTLFSGFALLLEQNHPTLLKESVMSPGGSTAQGVAALEKHALKNAFLEAILASKNFA